MNAFKCAIRLVGGGALAVSGSLASAAPVDALAGTLYAFPLNVLSDGPGGLSKIGTPEEEEEVVNSPFIDTPVTFAPGVTIQSTSATTVFGTGWSGTFFSDGDDRDDWYPGEPGPLGLDPFGPVLFDFGAASATVTFSFDAPVTGVGVFFNGSEKPTGNAANVLPAYPGTITLEAFNGLMLLETLTVDLPAASGGVNTGLFRGFQRDAAEITAFAVTGGGFGLNGLTIQGSPVPVPLPAAAWLLLAGMGGLALAGRKRRAAA